MYDSCGLCSLPIRLSRSFMLRVSSKLLHTLDLLSSHLQLIRPYLLVQLGLRSLQLLRALGLLQSLRDEEGLSLGRVGGLGEVGEVGSGAESRSRLLGVVGLCGVGSAGVAVVSLGSNGSLPSLWVGIRARRERGREGKGRWVW